MPRWGCALFAMIEQHPSLFTAEFDEYSGAGNWGCAVPPFNCMRRCAEAGCDLCLIMTSASGKNTLVNQLPEEVLETRALRLSRSLISHHQDVMLYLDFDDLLPPKTFVRIPSPWKQLPPAQLSQRPDEVQMIRTWIQNCLGHHPECGSAHQDFTPTRLLDLRAFANSDDLRLVELGPQNRQWITYLALSHCWGQPPSRPPLKTTRANIRQHTKRIPFGSLSKTFQDAVVITRGVGPRYLWIDSLCIVQDDADDWAREAKLMADVYGHALCTLCALSSEHGAQGCRVNGGGEQVVRPRYIDLDLDLSLDRELGRRADNGEGGRILRVRLFETPDATEDRRMDWHDEYGDDRFKYRSYTARSDVNPLRTRAWTLQERELSPRCAHFSRRTLLWECRALKASAEVPHGLLRVYDDLEPAPLSDGLGGGESQRRWYELVEDYSGRFLTQEGDKLFALAGLATDYRRRHGLPPEAFLAGLWRPHLPAALLWRVRSDVHPLPGEKPRSTLAAFLPRRPMRRRAPSWSWAALDGEVTYQSQRTTGTSGSGAIRPQASLSQCEVILGDCAGEEVPGKGKEAQDIDINGQENASIAIAGRVVRMKFDFLPPPLAPDTPYAPLHDLGDPGARRLRGGGPDGNAPLGVVFPDIISELQFVGELFCLSVLLETEESRVALPHQLYGGDEASEGGGDGDALVMGLALLPEDLSRCVFRRVGLIRWVRKAAFDKVGVSGITLV